MSWVRGLLFRLRRLVLARQARREREEEIAFHVDMQTRRNVERGMRSAAARTLAEREFAGSPTVAPPGDPGRASPGADLRADLRLALRSLRREPVFAAMAILTLAVGIGAATATFSVVDAVLLEPLPFGAPDRLVALWQVTRASDRAHVSLPNFRDWQAATRSFAAMATLRGGTTTVLGSDEPVLAEYASVSGRFFDVLAVRPALGRTFGTADATPGAAPVAVVSHDFWLRALGGRRDALGRGLTLFGRTFEVVGVMPEGIAFPASAELWVPRELLDTGGEGRDGLNDRVIARLAPGIALAQAAREMSALAARLRAEHPSDNPATDVRVFGLRDDMVGPARLYLQLLLGAVALVLLVSCVNIASAVLARASTRGRELAVRVALGAGRARLVRQLLTESLVLALAGGAAGFALALLLVRAVLRLAPSSIPRVAEIGVSWEVALFALAVSAATGLLVGVVPAVQSTGLPPSLALGAGGRGAVGDRRGRLRGALVGVEVALALVLLAGAGLLIRSLARLLSQDPGFAPRGVLVARVVLPSSRYAGGPARRRFYDELLPTLRALPGVAAAGATNAPPLVWGPNGGLAVEGREESAQAHYRVVSPELMRALGVPLLRGRPLEARDDSAASHAALVNAAFAARVWPGVDAVGRRIRFLGMDAHNDVWLTVVGVVGDMRQIALESAPAPEVYVSYRQRPERAGAMSIVIRTSGAPAALAPAVRAAVRARDPLVPVELTTMDERVRRSVADRRFVMLVLAAFGAVALVLAAAGIYGVLSYTVARRTREIGVRVALGAQRGTVLAMVLRDAMRPVLAGAAAGAVAALLLGRLMRGLVYGVGVADPVALGLAAALLLAVALAASWMPAHRAARVDPLTALRVD